MAPKCSILFDWGRLLEIRKIYVRKNNITPEEGLMHPTLNSSVPSLPPCQHDAPIAVPRRASNPPPRRSRVASTVDQQSAHRHGRRRRKHPMPQNQSSAHPCPALPRTSLTSIVFNQLKVYQTYPQHNKTTTQEKNHTVIILMESIIKIKFLKT